MADTLTSNYGWIKPEVTGSPDTWGTKLNDDLDDIDEKLKEVEDIANAAAAAAPKVVLSKTYIQSGAVSVDAGALTSWAEVPIDEESDPDGLCTYSANKFTFSADGYVRWRMMPFALLSGTATQFRAQSRLYNVTDATVLTEGNMVSFELGSATGKFTCPLFGEAPVVAGKQYKLEIAAKFATTNGAFAWMSITPADVRFGSPRVVRLDYFKG